MTRPPSSLLLSKSVGQVRVRENLLAEVSFCPYAAATGPSWLVGVGESMGRQLTVQGIQ